MGLISTLEEHGVFEYRAYVWLQRILIDRMTNRGLCDFTRTMIRIKGRARIYMTIFGTFNGASLLLISTFIPFHRRLVASGLEVAN